MNYGDAGKAYIIFTNEKSIWRKCMKKYTTIIGALLGIYMAGCIGSKQENTLVAKSDNQIKPGIQLNSDDPYVRIIKTMGYNTSDIVKQNDWYIIDGDI
jgi:hypothetical protein